MMRMMMEGSYENYLFPMSFSWCCDVIQNLPYFDDVDSCVAYRCLVLTHKLLMKVPGPVKIDTTYGSRITISGTHPSDWLCLLINFKFVKYWIVYSLDSDIELFDISGFFSPWQFDNIYYIQYIPRDTYNVT